MSVNFAEFVQDLAKVAESYLRIDTEGMVPDGACAVVRFNIDIADDGVRELEEEVKLIPIDTPEELLLTQAFIAMMDKKDSNPGNGMLDIEATKKMKARIGLPFGVVWKPSVKGSAGIEIFVRG